MVKINRCAGYVWKTWFKINLRFPQIDDFNIFEKYSTHIRVFPKEYKVDNIAPSEDWIQDLLLIMSGLQWLS